MKRITVLPVVMLLLAGCVSTGGERVGRVWKLEELDPGYALMLATFEHVPGKSAFSATQVYDDAWYVTSQLSALGYQAFMMDEGPNRVRVGVRATSWALALALQREIDARRCIDLPDGNKLPVPETTLVNIAELRIPQRRI